MDMNCVVTNEVGHLSLAVRPAALTIDFSAHQATTLHRTPDPSHQHRVAILTPPRRQVACQPRTPPGSATLTQSSSPGGERPRSRGAG